MYIIVNGRKAIGMPNQGQDHTFQEDKAKVTMNVMLHHGYKGRYTWFVKYPFPGYNKLLPLFICLM